MSFYKTLKSATIEARSILEAILADKEEPKKATLKPMPIRYKIYLNNLLTEYHFASKEKKEDMCIMWHDEYCRTVNWLYMQGFDTSEYD